MNLEVSTAAVDGAGMLLVSVEGDLDIASADRMAEPAEVAVNTGCALVVDLSDCTFIDSIGLRCVLQAHRALTDAGGAMAIVAPSSQVRRMLSITAIDLRVRVFSTRGEAIGALRAAEAQAPAAGPAAASTNGEPANSSPEP